MRAKYKIVILKLIYMKIYCPSHKRPDAPLFSISKNLIIVLQHEDEIEEYKRINEPRGHQIICIDTPGLLPARNWILEQNDNWSMQIDDDINEVFTWNKENKSYENTDWNTFIEYTEKVVNEVDHSKTGMIGYRFFVRGHIPKNNKEYEMTKTYFCLYQCVILNNKLLKSLNFKYKDLYIQMGIIIIYGRRKIFFLIIGVRIKN